MRGPAPSDKLTLSHSNVPVNLYFTLFCAVDKLSMSLRAFWPLLHITNQCAMIRSMTDIITDQKRRVQAFIKSRVITKAELAEMAGLGERGTILIRARDDDWNPTSDTLAKLVRAIDKFETSAAKKKAREAAKLQASAA